MSSRSVMAAASVLAFVAASVDGGFTQNKMPRAEEEGAMPQRIEKHLTPAQEPMVETWKRHTALEFEARSTDATMTTMAADPYVNHVP